MMQTIWKYQVEFNDLFQVSMPKSAEVLSVQIQNGAPVMWAIVNPDEEKRIRTFRLSRTGHPISGKLIFIDTFQIEDEGLVFHLFEVL